MCEQLVAGEEYARAVAEATRFLTRPRADLIRHMQRRMAEAAEQLRFERASRIKQHIELLHGALQPQIVERDVGQDQDVLHFDSGGVLILHICRGVVTSCTLRDLAGASADKFLLDRYVDRCPAEVIVNDVGDARPLEQQLAGATGHRVRIMLTHSGRTTANRLIKLCALNHVYRLAPV